MRNKSFWSTRLTKRWRSAAALAGLLSLLAAARARADVFVLESGEQLTGEVVENKNESRDRLTISLQAGGRVSLERSRVTRHIRQSPAEAEYAHRSPGVADTVESHWRMAMWCREQRMSAEFKRHLGRLLELDPSHEEARRLLGFQKVGDRWMTREDVMASRGMIRYDGEYRTRQEAAMLERAKRGKLVAADWRARLAKWRRWLTSNDAARAAEARDAFETLEDPGSAKALAALLAREQDYGVRTLLIDAASRLEHPAAVQALVRLSLEAGDEETRLLCLEHLVRARRPGLAAPYVEALRSNNNVKVNRAAEALGEIGSEDAISPLIDALVTVHTRKVGNESGGDSYQFTPSNGGFQFGGNGPKTIKEPIKNPKALSALVRLTEGISFGYDQPRWRDWLASRADADAVDLRRDP